MNRNNPFALAESNFVELRKPLLERLVHHIRNLTFSFLAQRWQFQENFALLAHCTCPQVRICVVQLLMVRNYLSLRPLLE